MPKTGRPFDAPAGKKWCAKHNKGGGAFLSADKFPENYSYCHDCKREYQRHWDRTQRKRPDPVVVPAAKLSKNRKKIIVHLPNDERGRLAASRALEMFPDGNSYL